MIEITRIKNENGENIGFRCIGHAGFARRGKDIVCASVSALVLNTINSIEAFTEDKFSCAQEEKSGLIEFIIVSEVSKESALLMDALFLGLTQIQNDYGKRFITVKA
ncbi:MAG: ribosomal-processing cysteine protease Prp [Lachnospiraceae bacterium]|nr:ribosomal-processing cysteine protease Prp [Lachnospiraceae bacterium]